MIIRQGTSLLTESGLNAKTCCCFCKVVLTFKCTDGNGGWVIQNIEKYKVNTNVQPINTFVVADDKFAKFLVRMRCCDGVWNEVERRFYKDAGPYETIGAWTKYVPGEFSDWTKTFNFGPRIIKWISIFPSNIDCDLIPIPSYPDPNQFFCPNYDDSYFQNYHVGYPSDPPAEHQCIGNKYPTNWENNIAWINVGDSANLGDLEFPFTGPPPQDDEDVEWPPTSNGWYKYIKRSSMWPYYGPDNLPIEIIELSSPTDLGNNTPNYNQPAKTYLLNTDPYLCGPEDDCSQGEFLGGVRIKQKNKDLVGPPEDLEDPQPTDEYGPIKISTVPLTWSETVFITPPVDGTFEGIDLTTNDTISTRCISRSIKQNNNEPGAPIFNSNWTFLNFRNFTDDDLNPDDLLESYCKIIVKFEACNVNNPLGWTEVDRQIYKITPDWNGKLVDGDMDIQGWNRISTTEFVFIWFFESKLEDDCENYLTYFIEPPTLSYDPSICS